MEWGKVSHSPFHRLKLIWKSDNNLTLKFDLRVENNGRLSTDLVMKDLSKARALSGNIHLDQLLKADSTAT